MNSVDPASARTTLTVGGETSTIYDVGRLAGVDPAKWSRRPRVVKILLENAVRNQDGRTKDVSNLVALANGTAADDQEMAFFPGRVLLQDFTGVPALVDLAAMRDAARRRKVDPLRVNPKVPVDLIIDHSVQVDSYGTTGSRLINLDREYERNSERYAFLRWAQGSFQNLRVVPPGNGICHQVNLEYLAHVVERRTERGETFAFPDTVVGTDSHTPMVNGLGVLGWGVGGIEAEAVMLGEPTFLSRPTVVGLKLTGQLPTGTTATDLVLTITQKLREVGVVEKFVEVFGPGLASLAVADRATVSNMSPESGATATLFPIDAATIAYLRYSARPPELIARVEAYARKTGLWWEAGLPDPEFDQLVTLDLGSVVPSMSGPRNPEERVALPGVPASFAAALAAYRKGPSAPVDAHGISDGAVVIAAITSCTNTSNPSVMIGAGLLAQKALARGLKVPTHVKTSLAPGSKVVSDYLARAGLMKPLEELGFGVVGYGCTTCIGNAGPLPADVQKAVQERDLVVAAVLSGNRNFEARIHNQVRANYLASPPLVVASALAGRIDVDLTHQPLGTGTDGRPVLLQEIWPTAEEIRRVMETALSPDLFRDEYKAITVGDTHWDHLQVPAGTTYAWNASSTYLREPPYYDLPAPPAPRQGVILEGARALALFGDNVSTDHISPAGEIPVSTPAGAFLQAHGVPVSEFNTYGSRRGDHEVMVRGTFANVRLKNKMAGGKEGGFTHHVPSGETMTIYDAAQRYAKEGTPLIVLAGERYGQGSSRDWAAKGPRLLGVRAVIARSYERIHRGNLPGMGVLPLAFRPGESAQSLGLTGDETFSLHLPAGARELAPGQTFEVVAARAQGAPVRFSVLSRLDAPIDVEYQRAGGILPYVLDRVAAGR